MKASTFAKAGVSVSAAAALTLGLCASSFAAGPTATQEDPVGIPAAATLVGVGSDTTQDVMYGIAQAINAGQATPVIASYTATGGTQITYRSGRTVARPNGSGAGYTALKAAIGVDPGSDTVASAGDVDFARASGTQGTANDAGVVTDIPFATDTVSLAVPSGSPFLHTNGGNGLTAADILAIYAGTKTYVGKVGGTAPGALVDTATGAADTTNYQPIHAFVPKAGSGSRQFFLGAIANAGSGIDLTAGGKTKGDGLWLDAGNPAANAPYIGAKTASGADVQEHDATVLTSDAASAAAIAPFSGAKYIGYKNGKIADPDAGKAAGTDYQLVAYKSSAAGAPAAGVLPYTGTTTLLPNPDYVTYGQDTINGKSVKLTRPVFNIIPSLAVDNPSSSPKNQLLHDTFVGAGSKVCKQTAAIAAYGFLPASNCGATNLRFDAPSTATVTATAPTDAKAGSAAVFNVSVTSNGNGGGTATITVNGKSYTGSIASGANKGTVSVTGLAAGSYTYTGSFTPALAGVAASPIANGTFVVAAAPVATPVAKVNGSIKAVAPKVSHSKKAKVTVTVSASSTVPTGKVTVVVKKGSKTVVTVKNKALAKGRAVVTLPKKLKKGSYKVFVSYTGDASVNPVALKSVTSLKVK